MRVDLKGKTAVVTGGSKGIGHAIARDLAGAGANVVICARNEEEVREAAAELNRDVPGEVVGLRCDMRRHEDVRGLIDDVLRRFDSLDILINNAGVGKFAPIDEITPESWDQVLETNLSGVFYACHAAVPHMRRSGGGWIINIGSLAGKNPMPGGTAYNASKFGLLGFTEALMLDVRHDGIRVSSIMPGSVETQFSGPGASGAADWKLQANDIAEMVMDLLAFHSRALPSRIEMRPSQPPKK